MIEWSVSPDLIALGPVKIRWYGLMFVAGFSIGFQFMKWVCRREGKSSEVLDSLLVHLVLGTTIGARLGHCLFYDPGYYLSNPLKILAIWEGGLASHGGALGVIIACFLFARKNPEMPGLWILDRIAIPTVLTGAFIRLGNLMNSEILGKPTDGTWGFIFTRVDQIPRHPAQLYESFCYFLIFVASFLMYKVWPRSQSRGFLFGFVVGTIFLCRIFLEFFKENQEAFEASWPLNMGQMLSVPYVMICYYLVIQALKKKEN
ncbi:MAG: prolipoprotein diacylglyceryl transferase [Proteobacteria bacterium]|jgi:prolipoprotein diacylglyceryl transferase|nr:prolipoprotein diacylglyceryl transferase [Pseudomonadota bacterium]